MDDLLYTGDLKQACAPTYKPSDPYDPPAAENVAQIEKDERSFICDFVGNSTCAYFKAQFYSLTQVLNEYIKYLLML